MFNTSVSASQGSQIVSYASSSLPESGFSIMNQDNHHRASSDISHSPDVKMEIGAISEVSMVAVDGQTGKSKRPKTKYPKIFQCTGYGDCKMTFTRSEHLARHIRKHTGERPFRCRCNRTFSRLDNLRQHIQTVHANEQHSISAQLSAAENGSTVALSNGHHQQQQPQQPQHIQHDSHHHYGHQSHGSHGHGNLDGKLSDLHINVNYLSQKGQAPLPPLPDEHHGLNNMAYQQSHSQSQNESGNGNGSGKHRPQPLALNSSSSYYGDAYRGNSPISPNNGHFDYQNTQQNTQQHPQQHFQHHPAQQAYYDGNTPTGPMPTTPVNGSSTSVNQHEIPGQYASGYQGPQYYEMYRQQYLQQRQQPHQFQQQPQQQQQHYSQPQPQQQMTPASSSRHYSSTISSPTSSTNSRATSWLSSVLNEDGETRPHTWGPSSINRFSQATDDGAGDRSSTISHLISVTESAYISTPKNTDDKLPSISSIFHSELAPPQLSSNRSYTKDLILPRPESYPPPKSAGSGPSSNSSMASLPIADTRPNSSHLPEGLSGVAVEAKKPFNFKPLPPLPAEAAKDSSFGSNSSADNSGAMDVLMQAAGV